MGFKTFIYLVNADRHGWLEVTPAELSLVSMSESDFSESSFSAPSGTLYLDETHDAAKFLRAWKDRVGACATTEVYGELDSAARPLARTNESVPAASYS